MRQAPTFAGYEVNDGEKSGALMESQQLASLRQAIQVLYTSPNRSEQHRADTWLQEFRATPEAWVLCLELLSNPSAQEPEAYFAANTLRYNCGKNSQLITAEVSSQLMPKLVFCLFDSLSKSKWAVTSQLSTALAVLILRSSSWAAQNIIADLEKLVLSQLPQYQQLSGGQVQQDQGSHSVAHVAMLQILAALPPACTDKQCSVHPNRRLAVSEALATSANIQPWVQAAFMAVEQPQIVQAQQLYLNLGLQLIHGWCELGNLPIILPQQVNIVQHVSLAALRSETASTASEALVSMLSATKDVAVQGSDILLLLVQTWQDAMASVSQESRSSHDVLQSVCSVLCAAAAALLPFSLAADNVLKTHFTHIAEQLLGQLTSTDDDVALTALEFWQDTYITTLQGLPTSSRQLAINSHTHLLQHLTSGLVRRTQLDAGSLQDATADARDLPDDVRMVRRELASALRDITSLVGVSSMSQYIASVAQNEWAAFSATPGKSQPWTSLECTLYAANVVLGQSGQGKKRESVNASAVQMLCEICCACILRAEDPSSNPKLLGTALTLVGGLAGWFLENPDPLRGVLSALSVALKAPNEKLARNAATTVYRLCQHVGLATQILAMHQVWVEGVLQLYSMAGGVQRRIGIGNDLPTEELLLASLCRLAMQPTASSLPFGSNLLIHLTEPKLQELRQALAGLVACAPMALQMLAGTSANVYTPAEHTQQPVLDPAAQSEFARATAYAAQAGVCLDVLHMVTENATVGSKLKDIMAMQSTAASVIDSPRASTGQEYGYSPVFQPNSTGSSHTESEMSRTSSFNGNIPPPTGAQQLELLSACNEQVLSLVRGVWLILQPCLPQLQGMHAVIGPACVLFTCALENLPTHMRPDVLALSVQLLACLIPRVLVLPKALALLMASITSHGLCGADQQQHPNQPTQVASAQAVQQLQLQRSLHASGQLALNLALASSSGVLSVAGSDVSNGSEPMAITLLRVTQAAIIHSCDQAVVTSDPDLAVPTLALCMTALASLPQVLALPSTLDAMLAMTRATGRSYDVEQCKQWLDWVQQFVCAPYTGGVTNVSASGAFRAGTGGAALRSGPGISPPQIKLALGQSANTIVEAVPTMPLPAVIQSEGLMTLGRMLESGAGPQLMLSILMAASGEMPPDLVQLLAVTAHHIWRAIGTARFSSWLEVAVMELATDAAPWFKQKQDSKVASLQELVCADTEFDVGRFKKLFKAFCGGKKKLTVSTGERFGSVPGSRSVSRSPSTLSSMQMSA